MTERLYYLSDATEGDATVLNCIAQADGRYGIELDRTLFHPQGGGQPADKGWIAGHAVQDVQQREGSVVHVLACPLTPGKVELRVDSDVRTCHARWHSAGHLIGYVGERFGWQPVKAHHWPGEGRITFSAGNNPQWVESDAWLAEIERWKAAGLARHIDIEGAKRRVRFGDIADYPCGGTHVANLADIGEVAITAIRQKKGQLIVTYALD